MLDRLESIEKRYEELGNLISQPEISTDPNKLQSLAQEHSSLNNVVEKYRRLKNTVKNLNDTQTLLGETTDQDMIHFIKEEVETLKKEEDQLHNELKQDLLPKDINKEKSAIVEIRAGTGGDEASLFAADLFRMYSRFSQNNGWTVDIINSNQTELGGLKEITFEVQGKGAFGKLKYERGVHRVQRVPKTEAWVEFIRQQLR